MGDFFYNACLLRALVPFGLSPKGDIEKQKGINKESSSNNKTNIYIDKVIHSFSNLSSIFADATKNTIPPHALDVNNNTNNGKETDETFGVINMSAKYPAEKLINSAENAFNQGFEENMFINSTVANHLPFVNKSIKS